MSERNEQPQESPQDAPRGMAGRRPARSGEGMESVLTHLREQESQRLKDDPTLPNRN